MLSLICLTNVTRLMCCDQSEVTVKSLVSICQSFATRGPTQFITILSFGKLVVNWYELVQCHAYRSVWFTYGCFFIHAK